MRCHNMTTRPVIFRLFVAGRSAPLASSHVRADTVAECLLTPPVALPAGVAAWVEW